MTSEKQSREKRKERVKKYLAWVRVNFKLTYLFTVPVWQKETSSLKYSKIEGGPYTESIENHVLTRKLCS